MTVVLPAPGYEDKYTVSDEGIVSSVKSNKVLKPHNGYVFLKAKTAVKISDLVLGAFGKRCPEGLKVIHLDGNLNNNALGNLTYDLPRCRKGHAFVEENIYLNPSRGDAHRQCVTCRYVHAENRRLTRVRGKKNVG